MVWSPTQENLTSWIKAGVFCVGMGSKLFPGDKVAAEDWAYVTAKCKEALGYIAEAAQINKKKISSCPQGVSELGREYHFV